MAKPVAANLATHQRAWRHFQAGQLSQAIRTYRQICESDRKDERAWTMLGIIQGRLGNYEQAVMSFRTAIALNPANFDALVNHGLALFGMAQPEPAVSSLKKALVIAPGHPGALFAAGNVYASMDWLTEAAEAYQGVLRREPGNAACRANLANVLAYQGRTGQALEQYREALRLNPCQPGVHSNMLLCLHYDTVHTAEQIFQEHLTWAVRHTSGVPIASRRFADSTTGRRLRIGYVTPDLRGHSVAYFFEPILAHHDRSRFEIYLYTTSRCFDVTTERLAALAGVVRDISGLPDASAAQAIAADAIDILVDLAGHTENNRLPIFAHRPAPIQMTYLGYPDTTGMTAIDYRLTDAWADPPGTTEHLHTERLLRIRRGFLGFAPPPESPDVGPPPAEAAGYITFGSFNVLTKLTPRMLDLWADIMEAVPGSRILIKNKQLSDAQLQHEISERFKRRHIDEERVELLGRTSKQAHMACYCRVDIALDSFPYNGTTTTCDALWMGVPVISLAGLTHVSRTGVSLLSVVGLGSLIASSEQDYVARAVELAQDVPRLSCLRAELRGKMRQSLCDGVAFVRELESVYHFAWDQRLTAS